MNPPGQENGVTSGGQRFTRVTRDEYHDTQNWAMTVSKATAREIIENPPAAHRQRRDGEPAFLRAPDQTSSTIVAPLLTILHAIPLAREALLYPMHQAPNYGYDPQWWTGHPSEASKVTAQDSRNARSFDDLVGECQRIMAFLDDTQRAYGSIDSLADAFPLQDSRIEVGPFLDEWTHQACLCDPDDPLARTFMSSGVKVYYGQHEIGFTALEHPVQPEQEKHLVEALDNHIWAEDRYPNNPLEDVFVRGFSDVVTIRLFDSERSRPVGVTVPATWYPERYMETFREVAHDIRTRRKEMRKDLAKIDRMVNGLTTYKHPPETASNIEETLLQAANKAPLVAKYCSRLPSADQERSADDPFRSLLSEAKDVAKSLKAIVESVEQQIETYKNQKSTILAKMYELATEFTEPEDESSPLKLRYTLRGVATKPNVTYLLRRVESDEASPDPEWQWWRTTSSCEEAKKEPVVYGPSPRPDNNLAAQGPYSTWHGNSTKEDGTIISYAVQKVDEAEVLQAAKEEYEAVLLVYATDHAVNFTGSPLSAPLSMFARADNKAFEKELRGINANDQTDGPPDNGVEMTQLHFTNSNGIPIAPMDEDDPPLPSRTNTDKARTPPPAARDPDGQPSPKRAKGKDEPPHYESPRAQPEMQERSAPSSLLGSMRQNKIGQLSEKMMNRIRDHGDSEERRK